MVPAGSLAAALLPAQGSGADAGLIEACGTDPSWACQTAYDATGSETFAKAVDWFVGAPLRSIVILLVAWIVSWIVRRAIGRGVARVMSPQLLAASTLRRLNTPATEALGAQVADPRAEARAQTVAAVLRSTAAVAIWTVAVLLVLGQFDIDLGPLLAGAGIAGIAIGFGAQSLVRDCINGLFMLLEDQYGVGDQVDLGVVSGTVEDLTLRITRLRAVDGLEWYVPNGQILRVGNASRSWTNALVDVTVGYGADLDRVQDVLRDVAERVTAEEPVASQVLAPPQVLGVERLGADGVVLRLAVRVAPGARVELQRRLRLAVKQALDEAGVAWPAQPDA